MALDQAALYQRLVVGPDIFHYPFAFGIVHEENDFFVEFHVRIYRVEAARPNSEILPYLRVALAGRAAPYKIKLSEMLK